MLDIYNIRNQSADGVVFLCEYRRAIAHIKSQDVFALMAGKYGQQVQLSNISGTLIGSYQLTDDVGELWLVDYKLIGSSWKQLVPETEWNRIVASYDQI